ncbi:MAG: DUF1810 domain-containing protein [Pseudomonadota bacterium]|nr:DUF1810 domain-containing protein [Pseudomonadota bacterium]
MAAQARFYGGALRELRAGHKEGHWMWFIFPQLRGLGRSESARYFGISSLREAESYMSHPILGTRLREITEVVTNLKKRKIEDIFPYPDDRKFHSSMTLCAIAGQETQVFDRALIKYFQSELDAATRDLLRVSDPRRLPHTVLPHTVAAHRP